MTWDESINQWLKALLQFSVYDQDYDPEGIQTDEEDDYYNAYYDRDPVLTAAEIKDYLGVLDDVDDNIKTARIQKAMLQLLQAKLEKEPRFNNQFLAKSQWKWLNQLLAAARIKELAKVRIVKKGRRSGLGYVITELVQSYYGRQILQTLNFNVARRKVVDKDEFATITDACAKIKLTLPEVIEATTTEQFFSLHN